MFFRYRFFTFFGNPRNTHNSKKSTFLAHFWEPFGSLRGTFGRLFVTNMSQRLQKVTQKRPNGSKAPPKGLPKWSPTEVIGGSKSMAGAMFQRHLEKRRNERNKDFKSNRGNAPNSPAGLNFCTPSSQTLLPFC